LGVLICTDFILPAWLRWIHILPESWSTFTIYAPINVMPDPREGGDTRAIDLISLLLGRGFDFIWHQGSSQGRAFWHSCYQSPIIFASEADIMACFRKIARWIHE
jgi:hypothetical protein